MRTRYPLGSIFHQLWSCFWETAFHGPARKPWTVGIYLVSSCGKWTNLQSFNSTSMIWGYLGGLDIHKSLVSIPAATVNVTNIEPAHYWSTSGYQNLYPLTTKCTTLGCDKQGKGLLRHKDAPRKIGIYTLRGSYVGFSVHLICHGKYIRINDHFRRGLMCGNDFSHTRMWNKLSAQLFCWTQLWPQNLLWWCS